MRTVGIDEVGRGCWAGPLVAGAVLLPEPFVLLESDVWKLADSKVMTRAARVASDLEIRKIALAVGLGWVTPREIERLGLTKSVRLAMKRALAQITCGYEAVIIDGNFNFLKPNKQARALIKADASVPAVSAASIVAKVARDNWMQNVAAKKYSNYGFDKHVGYGTKQHIEALATYGVTSLHRKNYAPIKSMLILSHANDGNRAAGRAGGSRIS